MNRMMGKIIFCGSTCKNYECQLNEKHKPLGAPAMIRLLAETSECPGKIHLDEDIDPAWQFDRPGKGERG